ncbi:MAG: hypothetical protein FD178_2016 [Ignavibacteria bacterium]|nr:MAG: hypothetical protein FD178_2016 [Ignavibacteria bacterium]
MKSTLLIFLFSACLHAQNLRSLGLDSVYIQSIALDPIDSNIIYAGGGRPDYGATKKPGLFKTTNGGITWDTLLYNQSIRVIKIDHKNPNIIYAAPNGIIKSTDGGLTWKDITGGIFTRIFSFVSCISIDPQNTEIVYAGVAGMDGGDAYKSTDGGKQWRKILSGKTTSIAINPENTNNVYVINGDLFESLDGGDNWVRLSYLHSDIYLTIHVDEQDTSKLYCGSYKSGVFISSNGGKNWLSKNDGFKFSNSGYCFQLMYKNNNRLLYVINGDDVYESTNDGEWKEIDINNMVAGCILAQNGKLYIGANGLFEVNTPTRKFDYTAIPRGFSLYQNYPNPFNPGTTIEYTIPASLNPSKGGTLVHVTLKVYDVLGREITTLVNEYQQAGTHKVTFNVETRHASSLPSGVYFYTLKTGSYFETKKMILAK